MIPEDQEKLPNTLTEKIRQQVMGQPQVIDKIFKKNSVVLTGPSGAGKTGIAQKIAQQMGQLTDPADLSALGLGAQKTLADRFKNIVMAPLTQGEKGQILDAIISRHQQLPESMKEEAKTIAREVLCAQGCDPSHGARDLHQLVEAIVSVSGAPDMAAALAEKYPVYAHSISVKSGERLAESFTGGTAAATTPLRPLKLKSGRVGFFALH